MEIQNIEINFFADESGQLHSNSKKRFFVIGGYFCLKEKSDGIKKNYTRALKKIKTKRNMMKVDELKTRDMTQEEKIKLITALQNSDGFNGFAIVVDKVAMKRRIEKENIFYNYFVKLIISEILMKKVNRAFPTGNIFIDMKLDSRNISVGHLKSLEDYLNSEYLMSRYSFRIDYCDSKTNYSIQATDLIANTIYMLFKEFKIINQIIPILDLDKIYVMSFPNRKRYVKNKKDTHAVV